MIEIRIARVSSSEFPRPDSPRNRVRATVVTTAERRNGTTYQYLWDVIECMPHDLAYLFTKSQAIARSTPHLITFGMRPLFAQLSKGKS